jgi:hypothetical protein
VTNALKHARCLATSQVVGSSLLTSQKQQTFAPGCGVQRAQVDHLNGRQIPRRHVITPFRWFSEGIAEDMNLADFALTNSSDNRNEISTPAESSPKKPIDFIESLHAQLRDSDVDSTLNLVAQFYSQMVSEHVFHSLVKIYDHLVKLSNMDRDGAIIDLKGDKRFQMLCVMAAKKGRFNTSRQVLGTVNTLTLMKFESDNKIMQVFLELAKHHVNSYHCAEIVHFGFLLSKCAETQQVYILKQQLTLALRLILYKEIHFLSSTQLCNLLIAFGEKLDKNHISFVMDALLVQKDSSKFKSYELVLELLANLKQRDIMLIRVCLKNIQRLVKIDKFCKESLLVVLSSLGDLQYYCQQTFTDIAHNISEKELTTAEVCSYLNAFLACRHCPKNIMDKYICGLEKDFGEIEVSNIGDLNCFLRPLALSNWKDGRLGPALVKMKKIADDLVEMMDSSLQQGISFYRVSL